MGVQYAIGRGLDICFDRLHDAGEADLSLRTRRRTGIAMHSPARQTDSYEKEGISRRL